MSLDMYMHEFLAYEVTRVLNIRVSNTQYVKADIRVWI